MARYLVRVANKNGYSPSDVQQVAAMIRKILGSKESASHFRVATDALEFNMFAQNEKELEDRERHLTGEPLRIISVKLLDTPPRVIDREEAMTEGVQLFNQERFWECHEILEQAWHVSEGVDRDAIQGLILTAAAFVHYQKGEEDICLAILKRARAKMGSAKTYHRIDFETLGQNIDGILASERIGLFKLRMSRF